MQSTLVVATVPYFNKSFADGWQKFLQKERDNLQFLGVNNATNSCLHTSLFPYNPVCKIWGDAISTVGQAQILDARAHYKIVQNKNASVLFNTESKQLCEGFASNGLNSHDVAVAYICGPESMERRNQRRK